MSRSPHGISATLRSWAGRLKRDALTVWLIGRDPRVPWPVKALALGVAAYAFSPIDLIPDFVPVLGYLDDLIVVPLGVWLVIRLTPTQVLAELRAEAVRRSERPISRAAAVVIVLLWAGMATLGGYLLVARAF
ncbi:MAG TPA: YkvA family protein [Alphaproteobacteria bacterium]